ncbi:unnamed protein product [Staurois parvus]|uniref:CCHC NOA-type domain-containing protein n=1 Tax=Staurois parvus TaxID=386267 RepID=A0ABN9CLH3_9NEOB|nr:unnamed protein product [Staurois parvus]
MASISDGSTDALLARFKLLEETVDKLHRENRSLTAKLKSYNMLSTFYHEARQQNKNLNRLLADKEALILKMRDGQHSACAGLPDQQLQPSKSLVDGLVGQLSSMKDRLRETERLCQEKVEALNQEIQKLHQQLEERDQQMQKMSSWPSHEKEMEIFRLHRSLAEKEKVQATSEVLCRSLSDETNQLRRKLAATAEMCQQLVTCLEEAHRKKGAPSQEQQVRSGVVNKDGENEAILGKLQEENRLLKQKVIHVEDLNAKWQKYDASREEYVKGLHQQLKEMKMQRHPDLLQKEISRLNKLLEEKMSENTKLQQEASEMASARIADRERIQMLEQQLLVYKDDFTSERADRERAQSRILELVEEISCLQKKARRQVDKDVATQIQIHTGNRNKTYIQKKSTDPLRGLAAEHSENRRQLSPADPTERQRSPSSEHRAQDELQCPRCLQVFHDRLGENFLEHISECCQ